MEDGGGKEDEALVGRKSESSAGCEGKRGAGNETEGDCANLRTTPEEEWAEEESADVSVKILPRDETS